MQRFSGPLKNWRVLEQMIYWLVWLIIIFLPLLFWDFGDNHERKRIIWGWIRIFPFFILFIIHNAILLPYVFKKKYWTIYLTLVFTLIIVVNLLYIYLPAFHNFLYDIFIGSEPGKNTFRGHGSKGPIHGPGRYFKKAPAPEFMAFTFNVLISILVLAFNASFSFTTRWLQKEQAQRELAKQSMQSQLSALQQQVSPHFFMNTLNNIHALIDYNQNSAKESVLRLSEMMRYLLYESNVASTMLQKEIEFLNSYIDLMRLRINESVVISTEFPPNTNMLEVPPFLFLPFVENAFKYGILPQGNSQINIRIEVFEKTLHFNCKNLKTDTDVIGGEHTGLGIDNARKRLDLLYDKNYSLNIFNRKEDFEVDMVIPVSEH